MLFRYVVIDDCGRKHLGELEAEDEQDLERKCQERGYYLLEAIPKNSIVKAQKPEIIPNAIPPLQIPLYKQTPDTLWCSACQRPVGYYKPFNWFFFLVLILSGLGWLIYLIYHLLRDPKCPFCHSKTAKWYNIC